MRNRDGPTMLNSKSLDNGTCNDGTGDTACSNFTGNFGGPAPDPF